MKITKSQLKEIIKEELEATLNEQYVPSRIDPSSTSWFNGPIARLNKKQIKDLLKGPWGGEKVSTLALALADWDIHPDLSDNLWQSGVGKHLTRAQQFKLEDWSVGEFAPGDKEAITAARNKLAAAALEMLDSGAHHRQEPGMGRY